MPKTIEFEEKFSLNLNTFFELCFLNEKFEEDFLFLEVSGDLSPNNKIKKSHITVSSWIHDINDGLDKRMKFYKIHNPDTNSSEQYSNVTEKQNYCKQNKNYCIEALVLPQSTLTLQPVFQIKTKYCE